MQRKERKGKGRSRPCLVTALLKGEDSYQSWTKDSLECEARVSIWGIGRNVKYELLRRIGAPPLLHCAAVIVIPKVSV